MQRFLKDLQRNNDRNGQDDSTSRSREGSSSVAGAVQDYSDEAKATFTRGMALHLLGSRRGSGSSEAETEIGSPAARDPQTKPVGFDAVDHSCLEDGTRDVGRGTGGLGEGKNLGHLDGFRRLR
ncbi:unnamed protein product [Ectocarpus sp. 13 AM-2016]